MASIAAVYGDTYQQEANWAKIMHGIDHYASNLAQIRHHRGDFLFRYETPEMWDGNNMKSTAIKALLSKVEQNNQYVRIRHINKTSQDINALPYLINGQVEYFLILDVEQTGDLKPHIYSVYITPTMMEAL